MKIPKHFRKNPSETLVQGSLFAHNTNTESLPPNPEKAIAAWRHGQGEWDQGRKKGGAAAAGGDRGPQEGILGGGISR